MQNLLENSMFKVKRLCHVIPCFGTKAYNTIPSNQSAGLKYMQTINLTRVIIYVAINSEHIDKIERKRLLLKLYMRRAFWNIFEIYI